MNVETAPALSDPDLAASDLDDLGLGREDYRTLYHTMRLQREFEERVYRLFRQGRLVGAAYAGAGHEAIAAGSAYALGDADILVPMHRVIGAHFLRGHTARDMMCQYLGRANGPTAGKDGNMHCGNWDHHIVGMISHLGANIPVAAGVALASKIRSGGAVSLTYIGEGGSSIGDFHEGLNFAAVHRLPMVLIVENNKFAYSTPTRYEYACEHIVDRARGYGIAGALVDGTDVRAVYKATRDAVDLAQGGGRSDPDRSPLHPAARPRPARRRLLCPQGHHGGRVEQRSGHEGREPPAGKEVLHPRGDRRDPGRSQGHRRRRGRLRGTESPCPNPMKRSRASTRTDVPNRNLPMPPVTYLEAISSGLREEMERDESVFCLGEDIGVYGGAFKITKGFLGRFR